MLPVNIYFILLVGENNSRVCENDLKIYIYSTSCYVLILDNGEYLDTFFFIHNVTTSINRFRSGRGGP